MWSFAAARAPAIVVAAAEAHDAPRASELMAEAKEIWRQTHDRDVDKTYFYMSETARRYGDDAIPRMYERVLVPLFAWRYEKFDIDKHPWDEGRYRAEEAPQVRGEVIPLQRDSLLLGGATLERGSSILATSGQGRSRSTMAARSKTT